MAEINIQRKSSSNALWWILAIVAIAVIAWFLFARTGTDTPRSGLELPVEQWAIASADITPLT